MLFAFCGQMMIAITSLAPHTLGLVEPSRLVFTRPAKRSHAQTPRAQQASALTTARPEKRLRNESSSLTHDQCKAKHG
jgi:hypothetical protein